MVAVQVQDLVLEGGSRGKVADLSRISLGVSLGDSGVDRAVGVGLLVDSLFSLGRGATHDPAQAMGQSSAGASGGGTHTMASAKGSFQHSRGQRVGMVAVQVQDLVLEGGSRGKVADLSRISLGVSLGDSGVDRAVGVGLLVDSLFSLGRGATHDPAQAMGQSSAGASGGGTHTMASARGSFQHSRGQRVGMVAVQVQDLVLEGGSRGKVADLSRISLGVSLGDSGVDRAVGVGLLVDSLFSLGRGATHDPAQAMGQSSAGASGGGTHTMASAKGSFQHSRGQRVGMVAVQVQDLVLEGGSRGKVADLSRISLGVSLGDSGVDRAVGVGLLVDSLFSLGRGATHDPAQAMGQSTAGASGGGTHTMASARGSFQHSRGQRVGMVAVQVQDLVLEGGSRGKVADLSRISLGSQYQPGGCFQCGQLDHFKRDRPLLTQGATHDPAQAMGQSSAGASGGGTHTMASARGSFQHSRGQRGRPATTHARLHAMT
ncbi:hypothetical protein ACLB2K_007271 [Fragaria x ananassa]